MFYKMIKTGMLVLVAGFAAVVFSGCSLPFQLQVEGTIPPTITQIDLPTETPIPPTNTSSPTITTSPTITLTPSETLDPTNRPTWTPIPSNTLRPTWTSTMTFTPLPTAELGVVLTEDFSSGEGWKVASGGNWQLGFGKGDYRMLVEEPYVEITSTRDYLKFAETRIAADIRRFRGDGYYGFSCRESSSAYYILFITSDGHYGIGERRNDGLHFYQYLESDVIETGKNSENRVAASCRGNFLNLTVNDVHLATQRVEGIGPGWVSMMIGTQEGEELEVFYDNLTIWGPYIEE